MPLLFSFVIFSCPIMKGDEDNEYIWKIGVQDY